MEYINGKSGSFDFTDGYLTVKVNWSETYDITLNTSVINVDSLQVKSTSMLGTWFPSLILKVDGQTLATMQYYSPASHKVTIDSANTWYTVVTLTGGKASWASGPIVHDDRGQKTIEISVVYNPAGHNLSSIQLYRNDGTIRTFGASQSSTVVLTDIPRRAVLTVGNGTLGVPQTLGVTRYYSGFTHTITCTIGSATETICQKDTATSYTWTPPLALAKQIPNAAKGTATFTIYTYNGSTPVGSQTVLVEMAVPASIVPTVTATWEDTSGAFDKMGTLVKLVSTLAVEVKGVGAYGSTVTGASMTLNGKAYTGGVVLEAGEPVLRVTVTDSRGRSGWTDYPLSVADYAVPTVKLTASRCNEDGTANDMGEFARITVTGNVVQVNGTNTATLQLVYGSTSVTETLEPGTISYTKIVSAPSVSTLAIAATLTDKLQSATQSMVLSVGYATLDFLAGGKGIAMGTTAKEEGFHCAMPAYFTGGIGGNIADYVVETGYASPWTYRKWNSGRIELFSVVSYSFEGKTPSTVGAMYRWTQAIPIPQGLLNGKPYYAFGTTNVPGFVDIPIWSGSATSLNVGITTILKYGTNNGCDSYFYLFGYWK